MIPLDKESVDVDRDSASFGLRVENDAPAENIVAQEEED